VAGVTRVRWFRFRFRFRNENEIEWRTLGVTVAGMLGAVAGGERRLLECLDDRGFGGGSYGCICVSVELFRIKVYRCRFNRFIFFCIAAHPFTQATADTETGCAKTDTKN
jgi:hypothetical protein